MKTTNDLELLGEFIRDQSQDAFTALVQRHLNLVYCAALRQVRSPQLAEEVAQSVFADLARNAARLKPDTVLTAWLYEVTRRTAINVVRGEARRQLREQIAQEMHAMNANTDDWTQIEPLLDDAMHALDDTDRTAVLLRFFENKSLREVGETLGTTDDTARKRVNRAIEHLRDFFAKRGVTVGASGLVVVVSANAVQAAPVGLAVTISNAAALAGTTIANTATITKAISMTTTQKALVAAALAAAIGTGIFEARQASTARMEIQSLKQQQALLTVGSTKRTAQRTNSFGIYLTTSLVDGRLMAYGKGDWAQVALSQTPIISDADIVDYDFTTHSLRVTAAALARIPRPPAGGTPFVVVADGQRIYLGAFTTRLSSMSFAVPSIMVDRRAMVTNQPADTVLIERAYPSASFGVGPDPRSDARVRQALAALRKLK